ncbi:MAG: hypothetical protein ACO225_07040 [Ilumatobacteraceae bacterium]
MPGNPLTDENWAADVTTRITGLVGTVRDKTAGTAVTVVRIVVFAMLALFLMAMAVTLLLIMSTRALQSLLDIWMSWERAVWVSYFILGGMLTLVGVLLLSRRQRA